ncbi:MAG: hypothetical protein V3R87_02575 [Dehalococcoidia bacterium]
MAGTVVWLLVCCYNALVQIRGNVRVPVFDSNGKPIARAIGTIVSVGPRS